VKPSHILAFSAVLSFGYLAFVMESNSKGHPFGSAASANRIPATSVPTPTPKPDFEIIEDSSDSKIVSVGGEIVSVLSDGILVDCGTQEDETLAFQQMVPSAARYGGAVGWYHGPIPAHNRVYGTVFLRNYPRQNSTVDGDKVSCSGTTCGKLRYQDAEGALNTVRMVSYIDANGWRSQ
jgi:hypothetical protein